MELSSSQQQIIQQLKIRGPQTVKILAKQIDMTSMGVRQHLADLLAKGFIGQAREDRQHRGRPVQLWKLTAKGHGCFPSRYEELAVDFVQLVGSSMGEASLNRLAEDLNAPLQERYRVKMLGCEQDLKSRLECLVELRSKDGFMAELRLLPDGNWLFIENHCPLLAVAQRCHQFCRTELAMLTNLLKPLAGVERIDHVLADARRCAYRVSEYK
jgi:predicted ArsR family transcriptional regulator